MFRNVARRGCAPQRRGIRAKAALKAPAGPERVHVPAEELAKEMPEMFAAFAGGKQAEEVRARIMQVFEGELNKAFDMHAVKAQAGEAPKPWDFRDDKRLAAASSAADSATTEQAAAPEAPVAAGAKETGSAAGADAGEAGTPAGGDGDDGDGKETASPTPDAASAAPATSPFLSMFKKKLEERSKVEKAAEEKESAVGGEEDLAVDLDESGPVEVGVKRDALTKATDMLAQLMKKGAVADAPAMASKKGGEKKSKAKAEKAKRDKKAVQEKADEVKAEAEVPEEEAKPAAAPSEAAPEEKATAAQAAASAATVLAVTGLLKKKAVVSDKGEKTVPADTRQRAADAIAQLAKKAVDNKAPGTTSFEKTSGAGAAAGAGASDGAAGGALAAAFVKSKADLEEKVRSLEAKLKLVMSRSPPMAGVPMPTALQYEVMKAEATETDHAVPEGDDMPADYVGCINNVTIAGVAGRPMTKLWQSGLVTEIQLTTTFQRAEPRGGGLLTEREVHKVYIHGETAANYVMKHVRQGFLVHVQGRLSGYPRWSEEEGKLVQSHAINVHPEVGGVVTILRGSTASNQQQLNEIEFQRLCERHESEKPKVT